MEKLLPIKYVDISKQFLKTDKAYQVIAHHEFHVCCWFWLMKSVHMLTL